MEVISKRFMKFGSTIIVIAFTIHNTIYKFGNIKIVTVALQPVNKSSVAANNGRLAHR
jgi:hypothetical protein